MDRLGAMQKCGVFGSKGGQLISKGGQLVPILPKLCIHHYNNISPCAASQCFCFGIQIMCVFYKRLSSVSLRNTYAHSNGVGFLFLAWCTNYSL